MHLHEKMLVHFRTHIRTRNLEVTGCESKALALTAEAHTDVHLELAYLDDCEFIRDVHLELELQDGATREHQELAAEDPGPLSF